METIVDQLKSVNSKSVLDDIKTPGLVSKTKTIDPWNNKSAGINDRATEDTWNP